MIKKILPIILCIVLVLCMSASAETSADSTNTDTSAASEEMPMRDGRQGGGRGGMGTPPQRENMQGRGIPPAMPEGEMPAGEAPPAMPEGEMTPPQGSENAADTDSGSTNGSSERMQRGDFGGGMQESIQNTETEDAAGILDFIKAYSTPTAAVILLVLAFVFVVFYKRKIY